ncbi:MAG: anaerobic ribonucleoside-triphosphate reductase [Geovibrio sp.]|jgi:ribonucleoside-triphosphate reductase|nr:anaerobic ribonucleoside-triphosphate reductase [Geovibrio sp.]
MSDAEIRNRIAELEQELESVKGTTCDVYSRVVGYHSPVSHWNEGKKEEFDNRNVYEFHPGR